MNSRKLSYFSVFSIDLENEMKNNFIVFNKENLYYNGKILKIIILYKIIKWYNIIKKSNNSILTHIIYIYEI